MRQEFIQYTVQREIFGREYFRTAESADLSYRIYFSTFLFTNNACKCFLGVSTVFNLVQMWLVRNCTKINSVRKFPSVQYMGTVRVQMDID